jgi:predicted nucleic acid-binding protein
VSSFVLDCSIAASWCFRDEATAETDAILEKVRDEGALVPALWHLELGNVLLQAERRKRLSADETANLLGLIASLPIVTDDQTSYRALREILMLARSSGLTTYDASYLELATRSGKPLATKDRALFGVARRMGVWPSRNKRSAPTGRLLRFPKAPGAASG